jgi:hypothetical protein
VLRLLAIVPFLFFNLYACQGGYSSCIAKIKDSHTIQNRSLYIPIKNKKLLVFSQTPPKAKILKHDPFLSLYLIEDKNNFAYPFDLNMRLQLGSAIVNDTKALEGKFISKQMGLNKLARYNARLTTPALITSSCCSLEGIATPKGVIQKSYLKRFLSSEKVSYSDLGLRVSDQKNLIVVSAVDPYRKDNLFELGDQILLFDNQKIKNAAILMQKILFSNVGSKHTLKIKRKTKILTLDVISMPLRGGGFVSDTFLEQKGIYFDDELYIVALSKKYQDFGLHIGDHLIEVNAKKVQNQKQVQENIGNFKEFASLLFERDQFQFFVKVN